MRYDEQLRRGYSVASGEIEGGCRYPVKDRMQRSGMRKTREGARSMLSELAAFQNERWQEFLTECVERAALRTPPHRQQLGISQPIVLTC
jgi:hypothetical protein